MEDEHKHPIPTNLTDGDVVGCYCKRLWPCAQHPDMDGAA